tara:strand:- start:1990 stop:2874 length:885 start_codon:yes stop_codon:yes gene_type:complete
MKILIAISSKEHSESTLNMGMQVAKAFNASTTIVDVGKKINDFSLKDVTMVRERMESWDIDRPGIDVLEWAFKYLAKNKFIESTSIEAGFSKNTIVETTKGRLEVFLKGTFCDNVNLILRNGDIVSELRDEVEKGNYDVTIIGGSKQYGLARDLVQYINSSILIVNQFDIKKEYRVLLAVDDSHGTWKAVKYGARVAQSLNNGVDIITVSKTENFGTGYKSSFEKASKFLRRLNINYKSYLKNGDPVEIIIDASGDNHIIVMGNSTKSPLVKFFSGSKPLSVMEKSTSPILIVK